VHIPTGTAATAASAIAPATAATAATTATAPATTAATAPATTTAALVAAPPATALTATARLRPRQQIHQVVEVALLLRAGRRILTRHHANQAHVVCAPTHHLQRLHQPRQPIPLDTHLLFDLGRGAHRALVGGRRLLRLGGGAPAIRHRFGRAFRGFGGGLRRLG
jgi:hypothetical protein